MTSRTTRRKVTDAQRPVWKEQWCPRKDAVESSGGREDQFWASGESGTLTPIVPVNHVPSYYPEQSSLSLTNPYPSSSNDTQYRPGMEREAYGPPPSSAGRRVVAQKTHSRESSNRLVSAAQTTQQSSREISRSSRTAPYAQSSSSTELRRQRKDDTSAYLGEFAQFRSHPESSSLRNHGMLSLSVSPANSHHSPSPSSYHNSTSRLHSNPTAASPLNNTTPSVYHGGRSTGSWYDYDTSSYQNNVAPHVMGQYSQPDPSTVFQAPFGSTPLSTHTHNMIYDDHQQTYIAQNPSQSYRGGPVAPTMYDTNPHYPHNSHSSTHGHSSSNDFHPY